MDDINHMYTQPCLEHQVPQIVQLCQPGNSAVSNWWWREVLKLCIL